MRQCGLHLGQPQDFVHCFLFAWEFSQGRNSALNFFFSRAGGFHLLLLLLNAHYNKRLAGRRPGWQFCVLHDRIPTSRRALRLLIRDAVEEGLVEQLPGVRDRRSRTYCLTASVVEAWERLIACLGPSLADALATFGPDALANVDYRSWNPMLPAARQVQRIAPYRLPHRV